MRTRLFPDQMSAPPPEVSVMLYMLYQATVRARNLLDKQPCDPAEASKAEQARDLLDAVHNIPLYLYHDSRGERFFSGEPGLTGRQSLLARFVSFDRKWQSEEHYAIRMIESYRAMLGESANYDILMAEQSVTTKGSYYG